MTFTIRLDVKIMFSRNLHIVEEILKNINNYNSKKRKLSVFADWWKIELKDWFKNKIYTKIFWKTLISSQRVNVNPNRGVYRPTTT